MSDTVEIDNPRTALIFIDYLATFCTDPTTVAQWRGVGNVIRSLTRRVEAAALEAERREAAVASVEGVDVAESLRSIVRHVRKPDADSISASLVGAVCAKAAEEIERLRWAAKGAT